MADHLVSHFDVHNGSIVSGPVPILPFAPGSGNVFPKLVEKVNETAWELWFFEGFSEKDHAAFVIGISRNSDGKARTHGFKAHVLVLWPDETTWSRELYFPESIITTSGEDEHVFGLWRDSEKNASISFDFAGDLSRIKLTFDVPNVVTGTIEQTAKPGDKGLNIPGELGPSAYCTRPVSRTTVAAELTFDSDRKFSIKPEDVARTGGGCSHVWSPFLWPQIMTESYYLSAQAGPYEIRIMRLLTSTEGDGTPQAVASLYRDGKLVCATQKVVDSHAANITEHSLVLSKIYEDAAPESLTGKFLDKNSGYLVEFIQGGVD